MTDEPTYSIAKVHVENFERIELVELVADSALTVVSSQKNKDGKSSLLHFLRQCFEGKGSRSTVPVHEGAAKGGGFIVLTVDGKTEFTVRQEIKPDGSDKLVIEDANGDATAKGQTWLKSLVGRGLAFDPAEFDDPPDEKTDAGRDKKRLEMLLRVAPLGIDLGKLKTQREDFYARRTAANAKVLDLGKKLGLLTKRDPPARVDLDAKRVEYRQAFDTKRKLDTITNRVTAIDHRVAEMKAEWEKLKAERAGLVAEHAALPPVPDTTALETAISAGERTNEEAIRVAAGNEAYDQVGIDLAGATKLAGDMGAAIAAIDQQKADALAAAKFPVPGLSVSEAAVLFNGLPYEQASDAERLEIAFAVCAADKPQLPLALIDVGERFDDAAVERVRGIATRLGVQVVMARRSPGAKNVVEIVDGRNAPAVAS